MLLGRVRRAIRNWIVVWFAKYWYRTGYMSGYQQGVTDQRSGLLDRSKEKVLEHIRRYNRDEFWKYYEPLRPS